MTTFKNQNKKILTIKQDPNLKTQNYYKIKTPKITSVKNITARNDNNMITKIIISVIKK